MSGAKKDDPLALVDGVKAGNTRAIARMISLAEAAKPESREALAEIYRASGRAHVIGLTGVPGSGKSTLVKALATAIRGTGRTVGIIAIDPSSPFSGGAILGDRIRMQGHTLDRKVFIRSMANRGHQGGVSLATYDAVRMLDASGFDVIIIETVGVGQSELAIAQTADTTILVLMPGSGDDIQAIKSGIMEIGDVFVVNKGDLPGANKSASEIVASLELAHFETAWRPPVIVSIAETGQGIDELWQSVCDHKAFLEASGLLETRRSKRIQAELSEIVADMARRNLKDSLANSTDVQDVITQIINREIDPHTAASHLIPSLFASR